MDATTTRVMKEKMVKCLWCHKEVELDLDTQFQFCDECLDNLATIYADVDKAERILRRKKLYYLLTIQPFE